MANSHDCTSGIGWCVSCGGVLDAAPVPLPEPCELCGYEDRTKQHLDLTAPVDVHRWHTPGDAAPAPAQGDSGQCIPGTELSEALAAVGLPASATLADLLQHHRSNAELTGVFKAMQGPEWHQDGTCVPLAQVELALRPFTEAHEYDAYGHRGTCRACALAEAVVAIRTEAGE